MTKKIVIEMLAPWTVAVYLDGEILDCFDCLSEAADAVVEACPGLDISTVEGSFCEDYVLWTREAGGRTQPSQAQPQDRHSDPR